MVGEALRFLQTQRATSNWLQRRLNKFARNCPIIILYIRGGGDKKQV
jgi:hypothetical protein